MTDEDVIEYLSNKPEAGRDLFAQAWDLLLEKRRMAAQATLGERFGVTLVPRSSYGECWAAWNADGLPVLVRESGVSEVEYTKKLPDKMLSVLEARSKTGGWRSALTMPAPVRIVEWRRADRNAEGTETQA